MARNTTSAEQSEPGMVGSLQSDAAWGAVSERNEVVQLLHDKGRHAQAHRAEALLPDLVPTSTTPAVLAEIGIQQDELKALAARRWACHQAAQCWPRAEQ
jgi:hypothetical protein